MKTLRKRLLVAATVAGIGLTTAAFAGPWGGHGPMMGGGPDCQMGGGPRGGGFGQRHAMMQQYHAERMELLAARLKLKPEQESAWKAFLGAQDERRAAMFKNRQEMRNRATTALAQFEQRVQRMEQRLAGMKAVTKAAGDLYAVLDPDQKQVMDKFFTERPGRGQGRGPGRGQGRGQGPAAMSGQPGAMPGQPGAMPGQPGAMPGQPAAMPDQPMDAPDEQAVDSDDDE